MGLSEDEIQTLDEAISEYFVKVKYIIEVNGLNNTIEKRRDAVRTVILKIIEELFQTGLEAIKADNPGYSVKTNIPALRAKSYELIDHKLKTMGPI